MQPLALCLAIALAGCGGSSGTSALTDGPTAVLVVQAASSLTVPDNITVSVKNTGGSGDYYLDFYGVLASSGVAGCKLAPGQTACPPIPPSLGIKIGASQPVTVLPGYAESLSYTIAAGAVSSVHVMSRPVNTAVYTMTSCMTVRSTGLCP